MNGEKENKYGEDIATETDTCPEETTNSSSGPIQKEDEMKIKLNMKKPEQASGKKVKDLLKLKKILSAAESSSACTACFNIPSKD